MNIHYPRSAAARVGSVALVVSAVSGAPALGQTRVVLDATARATAASQPSASAGQGGAVAVGIQIDPSIVYEDGDNTYASIRGSASVDQYTGNLSATSSLSASASIRHRLDARTTVGVGASAFSTRSAVQDFLRRSASFSGIPEVLTAPADSGQGGTQVPLSPGPVGAGPGLDVLELSTGRTTSYGITGSIGRTLSTRDSLTLASEARWTFSEDPRAGDYQASTLSLGYDRRLSERVSLNAQVTAGRASYSPSNQLPSGGQSTYFTPVLGLGFRLSETLTGKASAGVSVIKTDYPGLPSATASSFAGTLSLCQRFYRGSVCAAASRAAQPTAYAGVTAVTSASLGYTSVLSNGDRFSLTGAYSRRGPSAALSDAKAPTAASVAAVSGTYNRKLGRRLYAFVNPGYSRTSGGANFGTRHNFQVSAGITLRLDDNND